jgi:type II secretory pathway pseudopilin PulG
MSLIEATIILMVIALLTSVIAPSIGGYVSDAQQSAAKKDAEAIASALARMLTDTGESWFLQDGNGAAATNPPSRAAANRVDMLVSTGTIPLLSATARSSGTDWDDAVDHAAVQTLDNYLVVNTPSNTSANGYRTAADMSVTSEFDPDDGATFNSEFAWRGAYLPGPIGPDPWGDRYAVNVEFLARTQGTVGSGSRMDVIVISAGINRQIDTQFEVDGGTGADDDIIALVSGSTR